MSSKSIAESKWRECAENSYSWRDLRERLGYKKPYGRSYSPYQKRIIKKHCKDLDINLEHIESSVSDEDFKQYMWEANTWHELGVKIANERLNEDNIFFQCAKREVIKRCERLSINCRGRRR